MSVHLFVGEEDVRIEEGVTAVIERTLPPESRALNLDVLDATAAPMADVIARLDTLPFFGDHRVVLVKDIGGLPADALRGLEEYLGRGAPPTIALFTARTLDRRGRLFKVIQRVGSVHACDPLTWRDAPGWVSGAAARVGKRISPPAAQALVSLVGTGLRTLTLELEKLAAYTGDRPAITEEDVDALASRLSEASVFALADAIAERNLRKAMPLLARLLESEHPLPVLGMIARQYRLLLRAKSATASGGGRDLAGAVGVHPFVARKLAQQIRRYELEDFPQIFERLEEADRDIKSVGHPELALETLVTRLCSGEQLVQGSRSAPK